MGIDMFPTDESLQHCEHALCSSDLRKILVLFPPDELKQDLARLISQSSITPCVAFWRDRCRSVCCV